MISVQQTYAAVLTNRAGAVRWPKPFIALRASRRTELERSGKHPNQVLIESFGHTGAVAEAFYLQTTEADIEAATSPGTAGASVRISQGQQEFPNAPPKKPKDGALMATSGVGCKQKYTPEDSNL